MKAAARLLALLGAVGLGLFLTSRAPRDVVLVYDVGATAGATRLEVELRRGGELVRRAEFPVAEGHREIRHTLRLPEGDYQLRYRLGGDVAARPVGERTVTVEDDGTIVLPLGS